MKIKTILIIQFLFLININDSFGFSIKKDSSFIKGIIVYTITNYIDSINIKTGDSNIDDQKIFVVKIEDTLTSEKECFFSLSFIANRSELYIVKPTHYLVINNKIIFIKCNRYGYAAKIGIDIITNEVKEKALKLLCDDSVPLKYRHYFIYFFHYYQGNLLTQFRWNLAFIDWLKGNTENYNIE